MSPREHPPGSAESQREEAHRSQSGTSLIQAPAIRGPENIPFGCPLKATGHVLSFFSLLSFILCVQLPHTYGGGREVPAEGLLF